MIDAHPGSVKVAKNERHSSAYEVNSPKLVFAGSARLRTLPCFWGGGNHPPWEKKPQLASLITGKALLPRDWTTRDPPPLRESGQLCPLRYAGAELGRNSG